MSETYSSPDLLKKIKHLTYRRLDSWTHAGYIGKRAQDLSTGSGNIREFNRDEAQILRHMAFLVHAGIAPAIASKMATECKKHPDGQYTTTHEGVTLFWRLPLA